MQLNDAKKTPTLALPLMTLPSRESEIPSPFVPIRFKSPDTVIPAAPFGIAAEVSKFVPT